MNNKVFSLASTIVVGILLVIGAVLGVGAMQTELDPITKQAVGDTSAVDNSVSFFFFLFYASLILVIGFTIWGIINNPRKFIPSMISVAVLSIILIITYSMASDEVTGPFAKLSMATPFWVKWSDVGIMMTYILFGLALLLLVVQFVRNIFSLFSK